MLWDCVWRHQLKCQRLIWRDIRMKVRFLFGIINCWRDWLIRLKWGQEVILVFCTVSMNCMDKKLQVNSWHVLTSCSWITCKCMVSLVVLMILSWKRNQLNKEEMQLSKLINTLSLKSVNNMEPHIQNMSTILVEANTNVMKMENS